MNYTLLEKVLCDIVKEEQIKLGYERETLRLYFPMSSLINILGEEISDTGKLDEVLRGFTAAISEKLGRLEITHRGDRYCILIPPEGAAYIHEAYGENPFLASFIHAVSRHGCDLDDLLEVFHTYSNCVICEMSRMEEFDYVIYFEDSIPDDYRYCIKFEGGHTTYHRFLQRDYEMLYQA